MIFSLLWGKWLVIFESPELPSKARTCRTLAWPGGSAPPAPSGQTGSSWRSSSPPGIWGVEWHTLQCTVSPIFSLTWQDIAVWLHYLTILIYLSVSLSHCTALSHYLTISLSHHLTISDTSDYLTWQAMAGRPHWEWGREPGPGCPPASSWTPPRTRLLRSNVSLAFQAGTANNLSRFDSKSNKYKISIALSWPVHDQAFQVKYGLQMKNYPCPATDKQSNRAVTLLEFGRRTFSQSW